MTTGNKYDINLFKHKIKLRVRFSDLDAMRHVNNATYLSYLEEARIAYFKDVADEPKKDLDFGAVVARIEIDYILPIMMGEEVELLTRVSRLGNKSTDVENLLVVKRGGQRVIAAGALTKLVSYDYQTFKSVAIPEEKKQKIREFEETQV